MLGAPPSPPPHACTHMPVKSGRCARGLIFHCGVALAISERVLEVLPSSKIIFEKLVIPEFFPPTVSPFISFPLTLQPLQGSPFPARQTQLCLGGRAPAAGIPKFSGGSALLWFLFQAQCSDPWRNFEVVFQWCWGHLRWSLAFESGNAGCLGRMTICQIRRALLYTQLHS